MDMGLNVNLLYKMNTENGHGYRYGNKFTANALMYYKFLVKNKVRLAPNAGMLYEKAVRDVEYGTFRVGQSGGHVVSAIAGAELSMGRVSLGANYQWPFSQHLASNRAHAGNRLMTHISLAF